MHDKTEITIETKCNYKYENWYVFNTTRLYLYVTLT